LNSTLHFCFVVEISARSNHIKHFNTVWHTYI